VRMKAITVAIANNTEAQVLLRTLSMITMSG
jgi:hypothetical protein